MDILSTHQWSHRSVRDKEKNIHGTFLRAKTRLPKRIFKKRICFQRKNVVQSFPNYFCVFSALKKSLKKTNIVVVMIWKWGSWASCQICTVPLRDEQLGLYIRIRGEFGEMTRYGLVPVTLPRWMGWSAEQGEVLYWCSQFFEVHFVVRKLTCEKNLSGDNGEKYV